MANVLGSLFVDLKANTADFVSGMGAAAYAAKRAGRDIETSFTRLGSLATSALAPFGAMGAAIGNTLTQIGGAAGKAMTNMGKFGGAMGAVSAVGAGAATAAVSLAAGALALAVHSAEAASKLYTTAQAAGVSTEALSALQFVARESNVEVEAMTRGLEKMSKSAFQAATAPVTAANAYTRLGIAVKNADGSMRPTVAIFTDIAGRFAAMPDGVQKTALAIQLFGRSGAELIPVLNEGKAGITELIAEANRLGVVLDDKTGEAALQVTRQIDALGAAGQGLSMQLMRALLPSLSTVTTSMINGFKDSQSGLHQLIEGIATITKVVLVVGQTIYSVLRQAGVSVASFIAGVIETARGAWEVAKAIAVAAKDLLSGNVLAMGRDIKAITDAWSEATDRLAAVGKHTVEESKKIWSDNAQFIKGLYAPIPEPPKRKPPGVAIEPTIKATREPADRSLDQIRRTIAELRAQAEAELALAGAIGQSTAATRLQEAAGKANEIVARLQAQADNLKADAAKATGAALTRLQAQYTALLAVIHQYAGEISALTATQQVAKDAAALGGELEKQTEQQEAQISSIGRLAEAYKAGESAIASAEIDKQLESERSKIAEVGEEIDRLSRVQDVSAGIITTLRGVLDRLNASYAAHRERLEEIRNLDLQTEINKSAAALAGEKTYIDAVNRGYLEGEDAVRRATAALQAYRWSEQNPGATPEQIAAMRDQYEQLARQEAATQTAHEAEQYSLGRLYDDQVGRLEKVRAALIEAGKSTAAVDAAIYDAQARTEQQLDDLAIRVGTVREKFRAWLDELSMQGGDLGGKVFASLNKAIEGVSANLAHLVVTGKSNFKELFQGLAEEILKANFERMIGDLAGRIRGAIAPAGGGTRPWSELPPGAIPGSAGGIGGILGTILGKSGGKAAGSSPADPLYVKEVSATGVLGGGAGGGTAGGEPTGEAGILSGIGSKISSVFSSIFSALSGVIGKLASGLGSMMGGLGGMFGGFLQHGGDVTPGKAYIVGERAPEFFVPRVPGEVRTRLDVPNSPKHQTVLNFSVHGVTDFDSFKRSQGQLMAHMQNQLAIAYARNR